jgi:hypothetical protein
MSRHWLIRRVALLSVGGCTFAFVGTGNCARNSATRGLATHVGVAAIGEVGAAVGGGIDEHASAILVEPLTAFFQDLFAAWVGLNIPDDPTFDRLLVE